MKPETLTRIRPEMQPSSLSAWLDRLHFSKIDACRSLGISRPTLDRYIAGKAPIPLHIALACAAIAQGIPPIR